MMERPVMTALEVLSKAILKAAEIEPDKQISYQLIFPRIDRSNSLCSSAASLVRILSQ